MTEEKIMQETWLKIRNSGEQLLLNHSYQPAEFAQEMDKIIKREVESAERHIRTLHRGNYGRRGYYS